MKLIAFLLFVLASTASASVISNYTLDCSIALPNGGANSQTVTGTGINNVSCSAQGDPNIAFPGHATASLTQSVNFSSNNVTANLQGTLVASNGFIFSCGNPSGCSLPSQADISAEMVISFTTAGPPRPGIMTYTALSFFTYHDSGIGSGDVNIDGYGPICCSSISVPIMLGQVLTADLQISETSRFYFSGDVQGGSSLIANFYEADGTTPVTLINTPEPATFGLVGFAMLAMFGGIYRRRLRESTATD